MNTAVDQNKDIAKSLERLKEAKTDTTAEAVGDYILYALWQAMAGDFTDESNILGTLLSVLVGFIPYVGQICDVRDLVADIIHLVDDGPQTEEWVDLGFTLIAFIPGIGDFLKKGDKVYSFVEKAVKDAIDSKKLTKAINDAAKKISERTINLVSKGIDKVVCGKQINETIEDIKNAIGTGQVSNSEFVVPAY